MSFGFDNLWILWERKFIRVVKCVYIYNSVDYVIERKDCLYLDLRFSM